MMHDHCIQIINNLREGVVVVDSNATILFLNRAAENILGCDDQDLSKSRQCGKFIIHTDSEGRALCNTEFCPVKRAVSGASSECDMLLMHRHGYKIPVSCKTFPLTDNSNSVFSIAQVFTDNRPVLEALDGMEEAQKMALHDVLTGLGNRGYAEIHLQRSLLELDRYDSEFATLFLDVDKFKLVNDTYGHEVGDQVLKMVAASLVGSLRSSDIVARWGGEEFLCLALRIKKERAPGLAEKLRSLIEVRRVDTALGPCGVTVSVGVTMARSEDTVESLVERVDQLMYQSKKNGRNRVTTDI